METRQPIHATSYPQTVWAACAAGIVVGAIVGVGLPDALFGYTHSADSEASREAAFYLGLISGGVAGGFAGDLLRRWFQHSIWAAVAILVGLLVVPLAFFIFALDWKRERHDLLLEGDCRWFGLSWDSTPAPWPLWIVGESGTSSIAVGRNCNPDEVARLFPEAHVRFLRPDPAATNDCAD